MDQVSKNKRGKEEKITSGYILCIVVFFLQTEYGTWGTVSQQWLIKNWKEEVSFNWWEKDNMRIRHRSVWKDPELILIRSQIWFAY